MLTKKECDIAFAALQAQVAKKLELLEKNGQAIIGDNYRLYLVDATELLFFSGIKASAEKLSKKRTSRGYSTFNLFSILNRDNSAAYKYSLFEATKRYKHVVDQDKVYARLKKEYALFVNSKKKALREEIKKYVDISPDKKALLEETLNSEISTANTHLKTLLDNPSEYKMVFTDYESENYYTCIPSVFSYLALDFGHCDCCLVIDGQ
jgi:hypothetical protein